LACGYQGGKGAFQSMAKIYGMNISDDKAQEIVERWRYANQWAVSFWAELESAAKEAMRRPDTMVQAGMVDYIFLPDLMRGTLCCFMAGGNVIQYPMARFEEVTVPWGTVNAITSVKASLPPKADAKEWTRTSLYGGLLAENCTQAFAAAILRHALRQLPDAIGSVHDEIILEVPERKADQRIIELSQIMNTTPEWASGLPLSAEPVIMKRYGK